MRPRTTIPLSTILKLEATKQRNATKIIGKAVGPSPLCDLVLKYFPEESACDEQELEAYARQIYPHLCEFGYQHLVQESGCQRVAAELKKAFPGVDQPLQLQTLNSTHHARSN